VLLAQASAGWQAFRQYGAPGEIKGEIFAAGGAHPEMARVVRVGWTTNGQEILALKVTKDATRIRDGSGTAGGRRCCTRRRSTLANV
jgi:hypothetical protein